MDLDLCNDVLQYVRAVAQDPSYPAYVDSSIIIGQTGGYREDIEGFDGIQYMRCGPDNGFFPDLSQVDSFKLLDDACSCAMWNMCAVKQLAGHCHSHARVRHDSTRRLPM